jgi:hypothetical protein
MMEELAGPRKRLSHEASGTPKPNAPRVALRDRHPLVLAMRLAAPMALDRGGAVAVTVPSQAANMNLA